MPGLHSSSPRPPQLRGIRRRWPRRVLFTTNAVVALVILVTGAAYGYVQFQFSKITRISIAGIIHEGLGGQSKPDPGQSIPPFTLLAIGSDSRAIAGGSQYQGSGASTVTGARSDSIVLIRINPAAGAVSLLSIPRDTIVPIPGIGTTRINEAFNASTPALLVKVLGQDFGIEVNHVAVANFDTFQQLANAVGGVDIWFPAAGEDANSLFKVGPGCNNLTGSLALAFVRSREYEYYQPGYGYKYQQYPESDLARIQRQQAFIKLALQKAKQVAPTDLTQLNSLVSSLTSNLTLDSTFSNTELIQLADTFRNANLGNIAQFTYPTSNSTQVPGALTPDTGDGAKVIQQWLDVGQAAPKATTTTTAPAATAPPTTAIAPSSVVVEVANGSGVTGQAGQAGSALGSLGYSTRVSSLRYSPAQTSNLVLYAPDSLADAKQVQSELKGGATIEVDAALTQSPYNLEVVTGSDYAGVTGVAPSSTSTTSTTSTTAVSNPALNGSTVATPDSSSYVNGQYVPPGLQPGQAVGHCPQ